MGGRALVSAFRFGLIRASSKSPNRKSITTFFQKAPILFKAINLKNLFRANTIQIIPDFFCVCYNYSFIGNVFLLFISL